MQSCNQLKRGSKNLVFDQLDKSPGTGLEADDLCSNYIRRSFFSSFPRPPTLTLPHFCAPLKKRTPERRLIMLFLTSHSLEFTILHRQNYQINASVGSNLIFLPFSQNDIQLLHYFLKILLKEVNFCLNCERNRVGCYYALNHVDGIYSPFTHNFVCFGRPAGKRLPR